MSKMRDLKNKREEKKKINVVELIQYIVAISIIVLVLTVLGLGIDLYI